MTTGCTCGCPRRTRSSAGVARVGETDGRPATLAAALAARAGEERRTREREACAVPLALGIGIAWSGPIEHLTSDGWIQTATFVYMNTVGIAELRQNLSRYLARVERGERLVVTDRNRPVAELGPPPSTGAALDRLIAEGRVSRPLRRGLPEPLNLQGDPYALSRALDEIRGDR